MDRDPRVPDPPFDWNGMAQDAHDQGEACVHCGNTFGPLYGQFSVTCAVCNRPWRTRRMQEMDAKLREARS